jgi:hypothetical protein
MQKCSFLIVISFLGLWILSSCKDQSTAEPTSTDKVVEDTVVIEDPKLAKGVVTAVTKDKEVQVIQQAKRDSLINVSPFKGKNCEEILIIVENFLKKNKNKILAGQLKDEFKRYTINNVPLQDCIKNDPKFGEKYYQMEDGALQ